MNTGTPPWPRSRRALMLAAAFAVAFTMLLPGAPVRVAAGGGAAAHGGA